MAIFGSGQNQVYMDENGNVVPNPNYSMSTAPPNASNVNTDTTASPLSTLLNQNQFTDNAISLPPSNYSSSDSSQSMSPAGGQVTGSNVPQACSSLSPLSNPSIVPQTGSSLSPLSNLSAQPQADSSLSAQNAPAQNAIDKQNQTDAARNLKSMYKIDNPALVNYVASTPGLTGSDLQNLQKTFGSSTAQQLNDLQTSDRPSLQAQANLAILQQQQQDYQKAHPTPPSQITPQQTGDNPYSSYKIGSVFSPTGPANYGRSVDSSGYIHETDASGNTYILDKSGHIINYTLSSNDPRSMASSNASDAYAYQLAQQTGVL